MNRRLVATGVVAGLCGYVSLSYEILWYRAFAFVSWGVPSIFALLLFFFLFGVAVGSRRARALCTPENGGDPRRLDVLARLLVAGNVLAFLTVPVLARVAAVWWLAAFALVAVAAGVLGAVLPFVCHFGIPPDDRAGARLSYVYLANIVGSAAGSFLTGFVLGDLWGTTAISIFLLVIGLACATVVVFAGEPRRPRTAAAIAGVAVALVVASPVLFDRVYERLRHKDRFTGQRFAELVENRHGVIAVTADGHVFGGGAYDGVYSTSLVDDKNGIERAFAVAAMHPHPKRVLVIGLASGSWAQVVVHLPGVEHVTAIEINPGYLELIPHHPEVASLLTNPKFDVVIDDGRRWLLRHPDERFDFFVMNTMIHFRANATNVLSKEFLELVRAHLAPGGIAYWNTTFSREAFRTAVETFPFALRVHGFVAGSDAPIAFDLERWHRVLTETTIDGRRALDPEHDPRDVVILDKLTRFAETYDSKEPYALETRDGIDQRTRGVRAITDDNMASEWKGIGLAIPQSE